MDDEALAFIATKSRSAVEWWARSFARTVPLPNSRHVLARVLGGYLMYLDMSDKSLAPHLAGAGFWETWITQAIARHVKRGMRCIDVGANFGYYTMLIADIVRSDGFVWSFEPNPLVCGLLRDSVLLNGLGKHVCVIQAAAGEAIDTLSLHVPEGRWGSASMKDIAEVTAKSLRLQVDVKRLDRIEGAIDFIKIDAEGMEPEVWEGMSGLITRSPNLVVAMEWSPNAYKDPEEFLRRIEADDFRVRRIDDTGQITLVDRGKLVDKNSDWEMLWLDHWHPDLRGGVHG